VDILVVNLRRKEKREEDYTRQRIYVVVIF